MTTTLILDHPYTLTASANVPHQRAYSVALAQAVITATPAIDVIDLQTQHYDPVMHATDLTNWRTQPAVSTTELAYLRRMQAADTLVFVFPVWWELMPATTLGFLDKVLAKGQAAKQPVFAPHLKVRILATMGTPAWFYRLRYGDPLGKTFKRGIFGKLGIRDVRCHYFTAEDATLARRQAWLNNIQRYLN